MLREISTILMLFEFPIPLTPTFVRMDFSELPIILGGFIMEPLAGFLIVVIKIGLNLLLHGTTTMRVGKLVNIIGN